MVERRKANQLAKRQVNAYFWRTYDRKEIDYIEEFGGHLSGYEFKWGSGSLRQATKTEFLNAYPGSVLSTVNQKNFSEFLSISDK